MDTLEIRLLSLNAALANDNGNSKNPIGSEELQSNNPAPEASTPSSTETPSPSEATPTETPEPTMGTPIAATTPSTGSTTSSGYNATSTYTTASSNSTSFDSSTYSSTYYSSNSAASYNTQQQQPPPAKDDDGSGLTVGSIMGIIVGCVAMTLMVAAFVIWYRRTKQRLSYSSSKHKSQRKGSATDGRHGDLADMDALPTARTGRSHTDVSELSSTLLNHEGIWDDPVIVAARIPLEKLEIQEPISRGAFGEVFRGQYRNQTVAIKKLLPEKRRQISNINSFFEEVRFMATLEHERIVQFVGVAWDSLRDVCVVSEFMDGGDLRSLLVQFESTEDPHARHPRGLDVDKVRIALHIIHAITYLHSLTPLVLHRDLKSKNILLTAQLDAKLADFGISRENSDATMTAGVGSSLWMAPEVMNGESYDEKADIFSFGVVLSELDTHDLPYASAKTTDSGYKIPDMAILQMVSCGTLRVQFSEKCLPELKELGAACVALDPKERPTAPEILYQLQLALQKLENPQPEKDVDV